MNCLLLRFDAPLMSFGGVLVDQHNPTDRFPGRAQLTGLIANALGWCHGDFERLEALQARIQYAARWDVTPQPLLDYHTVDLGQEHLRHPGWTTRGIPEHREGGPAARFGTHQRYRHYWADGVLTVALSLSPGTPSLGDIEQALRRPARPLFLGRKTCLPAAPIVLEKRSANDVLEALGQVPMDPRAGTRATDLEACWPPGLGATASEERQRVYRTDDRRWCDQIHVGQRTMVLGQLRGVPPCT